MITLYQIFTYFEDQKSLIERGEKAVNASDIQSFSWDADKGEIFSKVHASMRNKSYNVTVILEDGHIKQSFCECPKGQDKCHHMAAVLIYCCQHLSSTDRECSWNFTKPATELKSFEDLFGKPIKGLLKKKPTNQQKNLFLANLKKSAPNSGLLWLLSPEPENSQAKHENL